MENTFEFITCEQLDIFASVEIHQPEEYSSHFPFSIIWFVKRGALNLKTTSNLHTFKAGTYALINKFTNGTFFKTWTPEEGYAEMYAIALHNSIIKDIIIQIKSSFQPKSIRNLPTVHELNPTKEVEALFAFIKTLFFEKKEIDKNNLEPKIKAALTSILKKNPEFLEIFELTYYPTKVELRKFMEENYTRPVTLKEFAKLSGRSLSTFNRDFKKVFHKPPYQWIQAKRLEKAKELLQIQGQTTSKVYLKVGFKDLAHFSKVFKKKFGVSPSEIKNLI